MLNVEALTEGLRLIIRPALRRAVELELAALGTLPAETGSTVPMIPKGGSSGAPLQLRPQQTHAKRSGSKKKAAAAGKATAAPVAWAALRQEVAARCKVLGVQVGPGKKTRERLERFLHDHPTVAPSAPTAPAHKANGGAVEAAHQAPFRIGTQAA